ncbi:conserved hypothetical protein [Streptosporangium roseum DSM 43021]|uniref:DUF2306 domain-containing protein n=1 Tax=Streptosporangium roseum (strain ATCC 12428 / DSM 43021 / JCM 3005 / KCTC 9067 / NCIMB 10171 / NRRL 2505 / NI 9100) TaxID=479432 RepID=D2B4E5_STRRD|nr:conserved hypothetical protein [Streptosporangium roseum DSM 43021]
MTDESLTGHPRSPRSPRSGRPADDRNTAGSSAAASSTRADWLVPAALIVLGAVPVIAGAVRLTELTGGAEITPENARFFAVPLPVVLHILSAVLYGVLGAFQFAPGFRRRRPGWHRVAGRVLVPCGLVVALSGLWMTLLYPRPAGDGDLLAGFRLLFGSAMVLCIVLGFSAIRRRDIARHRAWMIRGYAIGLGAGTQALTHLPWFLIFGTPGEFPRALLVGAGWVINLAVAEWIIRGRSAVRPRTRLSS